MDNCAWGVKLSGARKIVFEKDYDEPCDSQAEYDSDPDSEAEPDLTVTPSLNKIPKSYICGKRF